jgi:hypothetical protein
MARARSLGDGRVVLALTEKESDALWKLIYGVGTLIPHSGKVGFVRMTNADWTAVERVQKVLGAARSSGEE